MNFKAISIREVEHYLAQPNTWLVDVRTWEEYSLYHIEGARIIPYEELSVFSDNMPKYVTYILYCERGTTSLRAAKQLASEGFRVFTVIGGLQAWDRQTLY